MLDQYGRSIDYIRISVTDRCNLRCKYCMPNGIVPEDHCAILRYEEILRICRAALTLGITKFKITGGEPLVRLGCTDFIRELKQTEGVEQVTMTTNGLLLGQNLDALIDAGLDAVNVSLDTTDDTLFNAITGYKGEHGASGLVELLGRCCEKGLRTKINTVLLEANRSSVVPLAALAESLPLDVRFIEIMPIGFGSSMRRIGPEEILTDLRSVWPDLTPTDEKRGNGPAHYYESAALKGKIGFIDAVSHAFCGECNKVRLTSTGLVKPCLCFDTTTDLRALMRGGCSDSQLADALRESIYTKPRAHCFGEKDMITEHKTMSQIGG